MNHAQIVGNWLANNVAFGDAVFTKAEGDLGKTVQTRQIDWWPLLLGTIPEVEGWRPGLIEQRMRASPPFISARNGSTVVSWDFPILLRPPHELLAELPPAYRGALALASLARMRPELLPNLLALEAAFADISTTMALGQPEVSTLELGRRQQAVAELGSIAAAYEQSLKRFDTQSRSALQGFENETDIVKKFIEETNGNIDAQKEHALRSIQSLREAQAELLTIRPAVALWNNQADARWKGLLVGAAVFIALLFVGALVAYGYGGTYFTALKTLDNAYVTGGLALAPILGLAWILRLVSRFMMTNLALWQDALHRQATAETYIALLGEHTPENRRDAMTKEERAIALNALFRPAPGSSIEDINPPTILELVKGDK